MAIDGRSLDAILFDIDGTIVETDDVAVARLGRWFKFVRWLLRDRDAHSAARRFVMRVETPVNSFIALLDRTGLDQVLGPLTNSLHAMRGIPDNFHAHLVAGVKPALARLAARYQLGVVSAREHRSAHAILESHALGSLFRCVATARTARRAKPHPAPVLWAVNELGAAPERCMMVGDTTPDIRAGKSAGMLTAGVLCGFGERHELEDAGADIILDSTADLADLLLDPEAET